MLRRAVAATAASLALVLCPGVASAQQDVTGSTGSAQVGSADPAVDAEVIQLYRRLLDELHVEDFRLALNSIGDPTCRPAYIERLNAWPDSHPDVLDDEAPEKRATRPPRGGRHSRARVPLAAAPVTTA